MKNKLLTLAVPTYNMEKYLARCLDSVLCDNKDYLEVLVVNDGSKDRSSEIGHKYEAKYPDVIRVIDKENGNYGTCVNRALAEAKGKYFRMLDADDWCNTEALNQWLEELKTCDADMVLTISEDRGADNELLLRMDAPSTMQSGRIMSADEFDAHALGYKYIYCSHVVTYRTELLRQIGLELQAGISYTDNEYVFFPLDYIQSVIYYDLPVYQYFVGREGQTTSPEQLFKHSNQLLLVFRRLFDYYMLNQQKVSVAVLNNQRILLQVILSWLYGPLFKLPYTDEKRTQVDIIDELIKKDVYLYRATSRSNKNLGFYRKTGLYLTSPIARMYNQYYLLLVWFVSRYPFYRILKGKSKS